MSKRDNGRVDHSMKSDPPSLCKDLWGKSRTDVNKTERIAEALKRHVVAIEYRLGCKLGALGAIQSFGTRTRAAEEDL